MIWFVLFVVVLSFGLVVVVGAPWLPTRANDARELMKLAEVKAGTVFYDLGCGSGGVLVLAAKAGAQVVGYELNPILWFISWLRLRRYGGRVYLSSFWRADLTRADIVFVFLIEHFMNRLKKKVKTELSPGAKLISYTFALPGLKPYKTSKNAYIYKF